jgi:phospholipid transport system substrate-binding protein
MRITGPLLMLIFCASVALAQVSPQEQVKKMVDDVLLVLNSSIDLETKKQQVSGMVQKYLGIHELAKRTLGIYWKQASKEELAKFERLYVRLLENTYLNRIGDYSGGRVDFLQERIKDDKAILDTLVINDKMEIPVQYKMVLKDGVWEIYDVSIEGVSLIRSYRSSYGEIVRKDGFAGLFAQMEKKLSEADTSSKQ